VTAVDPATLLPLLDEALELASEMCASLRPEYRDYRRACEHSIDLLFEKRAAALAGQAAPALPAGWTKESYPRYYLCHDGLRVGYVERTEHGWHWWVYNHDPAGSGYAATEAEARQHVIAGATKEPEPRA
jgi:hypothetical protein